MYDFTKSEMEIVNDSLQAYIANFGKPRIVRGDDGESFYVFTDDSDLWRQYCYNIDYLNGWLYGCVQTINGNPKPDREMREMCDSAGWRERYAIMHGERGVKISVVINAMYSHIQKMMSIRMQMELYMTQ